MISFTKTNNSVMTKNRMYNKFSNVFKNLRSKREISVIKFVYILNKSLFLSLYKFLSYVRVCVLSCVLYALETPCKSCTMYISLFSSCNNIRTTLRF